jgi:hypothetical protein
MKRLTDITGERFLNIGVEIRQVYKQLAAYEDLDRTPEELAADLLQVARKHGK